jgi:rhamnosyltransferase
VIIPTLNAGRGLDALLRSLQRQELDGELEIVIIDSGSRDDTISIATELGAVVYSVDSGEFNHGRTRNQAIRSSSGEFVLLTVQDALPTDGHWAARLLAPLLDSSRVAGSFGLQVAPPEAGPLAQARSLLWQDSNSQPGVSSIEGSADFEALAPEQKLAIIRFDNVTACLRRSVWKATPFQERNYGEDMAWARDVLLEGFKIAYIPEAQVYHYHDRTWTYDLRRAYIHGRTRVDLTDWPALPYLRLREALTLLVRASSLPQRPGLAKLTDFAAIHSFLSAELERSQEWATRPRQVYGAALAFSRQLLDKVLDIRSTSLLPRGVWKDIYQYAIVAVVGDRLGETAFIQQRQAAPGERAAWDALHWTLDRGI